MAGAVFGALVLVTLVWWAVVFTSRQTRKMLWPRYRFRQLPWRIRDLLLVWLLFLLALAVSTAVSPLSTAKEGSPVHHDDTQREDLNSPGRNEDETSQGQHWVLVLIQSDRSLKTVLLCLLGTGILGPIAEEILFRGFLQGWSHRLEWEHRRTRLNIAPIRRQLPLGAASVALVAVLFAMVHYRPDQPSPSVDVIRVILIRQTLAYSLFLPVALAIVALKDKPRGLRLIYDRRWFFCDITLGAGWFLAWIVPVYFVQGALKTILPWKAMADPCTMIVIGTILGTLFARTGRLAASIVFHVLLNITSLSLAFLM